MGTIPWITPYLDWMLSCCKVLSLYKRLQAKPMRKKFHLIAFLFHLRGCLGTSFFSFPLYYAWTKVGY